MCFGMLVQENCPASSTYYMTTNPRLLASNFTSPMLRVPLETAKKP